MTLGKCITQNSGLKGLWSDEQRNIVHTAGGIIVSPGVDISPTIQQPLWILSYNCVGLHLRQSAGDKARCTVVDSLLAECDILCLLET